MTNTLSKPRVGLPANGHQNRTRETTLVVPLLLSICLALGCGAGRVIGPTPAPPYLPGPGTTTEPGGGGNNGGASTALAVTLAGLTFVPDRVLSFSLRIESVALRSPTGDVQLLPDIDFRRFELTRHSLWPEPVAFLKVPAGTYNAITIRVSSPTITFVDDNGKVQQVTASLSSPTQIINAPVVVGSTPAFVSLTLSGDAISFGAGDVVSFTPKFTSAGPFEVQNGVGIVNGLVGRVTSEAPGEFGLAVEWTTNCCFPGEYETFTFTTDSNTDFDGVAGAGELTRGITVEVDAGLYADGSLRANKVKLISNVYSAVVFEGIARELTPAQISLVVRDAHWPYDVFDPLPNGSVVNISTSTEFRTDSQNVDLENLDFLPAFDGLNMAPGQNIRATAADAANSANPDQLTLEQQAIEGVASNVASGSVSNQYSFQLKFSPDSALAKITGSDSVLVIVQPPTYLDTGDPMAACISCIPGKRVRARGLLFYSGGQYQFVASEIAIL